MPLELIGGLYTEATPETLPLGASPLVINCDFILGSAFQRPGKESVYYFGDFFVERIAGFAESVPGSHVPNEQAWTTPLNATLGIPGSYAIATLNQIPVGIVDTFDQEVGTIPVADDINVSLSLTPTVDCWVMIDETFTGASPFFTLPLPSGFSSFPTGAPNNVFVSGEGVFPAGVPISTSTTQTFGSNIGCGSGVMIACPTNGSTPVVTLIGSSGVGVNFATSSNAVVAGTTLVAVIKGQLFSTSGQTIASFTDTNGNVYQLAAGIHANFTGVYGAMNWVFICKSANASSGSVTYSYPSTAPPSSFFNIYQVTNLGDLPATSPFSEVLKTLNYPFSLPSTIVPFGFQLEVSGHQNSQNSDVFLTASLLNPSPTSPTFNFQLPASDGTVTIALPTETWGLALTTALFNNPNFGIGIVAQSQVTSGSVFDIYAAKIKIWVSPDPPPSFNYIKTFSETGGEVLTLALGSDGIMFQEDAINDPGVLFGVYTQIEPDSFAQSATVDDREFIAISNLQNGTDIPYTYTPPNFDRLSQVGPGAAPSASTTSAASTIISITQNPAVSIPTSTGGKTGSWITWSDSPGDAGTFGTPATPGNVMSWSFPHSFVLPSYIKVGVNIVIAGVQSMNGYDPNNGVGSNPPFYTITSVGQPIPGGDYYVGFSFTLPQTGFYNLRFQHSGTPVTFESTIATMTTSVQIPNLEVGNQFQLSGTGGAPPAGYDSTWTVLDTPNAAQMQITSTQLIGNVATYGFNLITGTTPAVGQFVTVTQTLNGNGAFNISNGVISSATPGSFSVNLPGPDVSNAAENGAGIIFGTIFTFDAFTIVGNKSGGSIVTVGVIASGVRKVCFSFLTRNGFMSQPSPINTFDIVSGASGIVIANLATGPSNVIARVIHLTAANGGNFYNIPEPVTVNDNGTNIVNTSTWVNDNVTTTVVLSFSDGVLLAADQIDIQGNNLFECIELGSCVALVPYAQRLFAIGEQNKIPNLLNYSFDGGVGVIQGNIAGGGGAGGNATYPLGWTVDPTSGGGGSVVSSPIFGTAYVITNATGSTQATYGMITQNAFQDEFLVPIINPSTTYSVRVTCSVPTGAAGGNLVVDLFSAKFGTAVGTFSLPLTSIASSMEIFTGTLLTTTLAPVPNDLVIRVYATGIPNGVTVIMDRLEPFPTELPNLNSQVIGSYSEAFEQFDRLTGVIKATQQNQQPVVTAFALFGTLYLVKTGSIVAVNDNNTTEPSEWTTPRVTSNSVGSTGPYAVTTGVDTPSSGEEWALIAGRPGLFLFNGSQPVKLSEEIQSLWNLINWTYGHTIWVQNDITNRRILVGVPLKTPNQWLPTGIITDDQNPTTPNVVLELNYKQLNTSGALMESVQIHRSYSGKLIASDIVRKWSVWTIKAPCAAFIQRANKTAPIFLGNSDHTGKIYQLVDNLLEDDGLPVDQRYATAGFVPAETGQGAQMGITRYNYDYATLVITGTGVVRITVYPNSLDTPYSHILLPDLTLPASTNGDVELPVNETGSRLFVIFNSKAVGAGFNLSRLVMVMHQDPWSPVRGVNN